MKVKRFTVLTVLIAILMYFSNAYCIVYIDIDQDLQDLIDDDVIAFTNQGAGVDYIFGREDAADVNPPANPTEYIVGEGVELQIDWGVQIQMSENVILRIEGKMTDVEDLGAGSIVFERFPGDDAWVSILIWGDNAINDNGIVDLYDCDISGGGSGPADEEGVPCWAGLIVMDGDDGDRPELVLSYCDLERSDHNGIVVVADREGDEENIDLIDGANMLLPFQNEREILVLSSCFLDVKFLADKV